MKTQLAARPCSSRKVSSPLLRPMDHLLSRRHRWFRSRREAPGLRGLASRSCSEPVRELGRPLSTRRPPCTIPHNTKYDAKSAAAHSTRGFLAISQLHRPSAGGDRPVHAAAAECNMAARARGARTECKHAIRARTYMEAIQCAATLGFARLAVQAVECVITKHRCETP